MPHLYVNTYGPLVATSAGRIAVENHDLPPFIDGSIRREPDLQARFPTISCICRKGKFAPRLRVGDAVAYMTKKGRYATPTRHWRLTAILHVQHVFPNHQAAEKWHRAQGLPLPSNCMVDGNPPNPLSHSTRGEGRCTRNGGCGGCGALKAWDDEYHDRADRYGAFVVCSGWVDVMWTAPVVHASDLRAVFGRVPGTRNPGALDLGHLPRLTRHFGIDVRPSSP